MEKKYRRYEQTKDFLSKNKLVLLLLIFLCFLYSILGVKVAEYLKSVVNFIEKKELFNVYKYLIIILFIHIVSSISSWSIGMLGRYLSECFYIELIVKAIEYLNSIPFHIYEKQEKGNLFNIIRNDIGRGSTIIYTIFSGIFLNICILFFSVRYMTSIDYYLTIIITILVIFFIIISKGIVKKMQNAWVECENARGKLMEIFLSGCEANDIIKTYNCENYILKHYKNARNQVTNFDIKAESYKSIKNVLFYSLSNICFLATIAYLGFKTINGDKDIGSVVAFITLLKQVLNTIMNLTMWVDVIVYNNSAWQRIYSLYTIEKEKVNKIKQPINITNLEFENFSYYFDRKTKVFNIENLKLEKGKLYGLIGSSGSGKTTLLKCITGLYKNKNTKIFINGTDISDKSLLGSIAFIPSIPYLFNESIFYNMRLVNKNLKLNILKKYANKLGANKWIESLPEKYDTLIGEGHTDLSGGQKQMLNILRGIISDKPIIILDEPFANLDEKSMESLLKYLEYIKRDKIVLFTSHNEDILSYCDEVIKLENGRLSFQKVCIG